MSEPHYTFGAFELFPERRLLLEAGTPLKLGPRAFDLLAVLVERGGEIVSNSELLRLVWPHAVVDQVALRVHLSSLRKALLPGNGGRSPISNISGRGYTFTIPIEGRSGEPEAGVLVARAPFSKRNLPLAGKRLIGRDDDVANLLARLRHVRLLSIVGPGGIGKTSVAVSLAEVAGGEYTGGIAFVDLATMSDPRLLWTTIAAAAHVVTVNEHVSKAVVAALIGRRCLVILDNCEHMVESAAEAAQMLYEQVPSLDVLATSREPLRADAEHVHRLAPLDCPKDDELVAADEIDGYSALELLVERTVANNESFQLRNEDVVVAAALCRKLDGLPLAIELVAAGVSTFGLRTVASNIENRYSVILKAPRTATARHQSLTAVLDWSYETLSDLEREVLKSLGLFQGAVDFQTASSFLARSLVSSDDAVDAIYSLHTKSLLSADLGQDEIQYRLLETTKLYVIGKLRDEGHFDDLALRHAEFFRDYFVEAEADWNLLPQKEWRAHYAGKLVELRAAIDWAMAAPGSLALGAELLTITAPLWTELGLVAEYRNRLDDALKRCCSGGGLESGLSLRLRLEWAKSSWITQGPTPRLVQIARDAIPLAESIENSAEIVEALWLLWDQRTVFGAGEESVMEKANRVAETSSDAVARLAALRLIALDHHYEGNQREAWNYQVRISAYSQQTFRDIRRICHRGDQVLGHMTLNARISWLRGFPDQSLQTVTKGVAHAETLHDMSLTYFLGFAACPVALWCGAKPLAETWIDQLEKLSYLHSLGFWGGLAEGYRLALSRIGREPIVPAGQTLPREADARFLANQLELFASTHPDMASPSVLALCETRQSGWALAEALRAKSIGLAADDAIRLLDKAVNLARSQGALSWELRAATSKAAVLEVAGHTEQAIHTLATAYGKFTEGFETQDLVTAKALLSRLRN
ncbi:winged helix-turn-helix domain-containing protein [Rhizobium sp. RAF36]|uniref:ATP-binding protein n=1 Tax=Rhizobium sp. RAF36 TaxID=3233055 RepID=UPI003F97B089